MTGVVLLLLLLLVGRSEGRIKELPTGPLLVGYASACGDGRVEQAITAGVNVVIWSFWNVKSGPTIGSNINLTCVSRFDVVHLASIGGWNGGHLPPEHTAAELYRAWKDWGGHVFDGMDWDLEGNDVLDSPLNYFSLTCLQQMGEISALAKQDGYIVSLVPPQSYLDFGSSRFSLRVNLTDPTRSWHPEFSYFGANVYAYLLAKYGHHNFDFISIQLYESYSRAAFAVSQGKRPSVYMTEFVRDHQERGESFLVRFDHVDDDIPSQMMVHVPLSKILIGLANGWAKTTTTTDNKVLFVSPQEAKQAAEAWQTTAPRGFMFWTIDLEGTNGVYMAKGLQEALHPTTTRTTAMHKDTDTT